MQTDRESNLSSCVGTATRAIEYVGNRNLSPRFGNHQPAFGRPSSRLTLASSREALIFVHLYKTGGTTLNRIIEWEYNLNRICSVEPTWWRWSYQRIMRWSPARMARMDVFKGHMPFGLHKLLPGAASYITVLREPVERAISDYYFARRFKPHPHHRAAHRLTLEEYFLQKHEHNLQSRILAGPNAHELFPSVCDADTFAAAKENVARQFTVVGLTERFDETLALLKVLLGWKVKRYRSFRVADNRISKQQVAPATLSLIQKWERFDIALYQYASSLFEKAIAARREAVDEALVTIRKAREMTPLESRYYWISSVTRAVICRAHSLL
jgi:galactose-3-O-sulfotransferase